MTKHFLSFDVISIFNMPRIWLQLKIWKCIFEQTTPMLWLTAQILIKNERMGPKTRNYSDKYASQHEYSDFSTFYKFLRITMRQFLWKNNYIPKIRRTSNEVNLGSQCLLKQDFLRDYKNNLIKSVPRFPGKNPIKWVNLRWDCLVERDFLRGMLQKNLIADNHEKESLSMHKISLLETKTRGQNVFFKISI